MAIPKIIRNIIEFMGRTRHLSILLMLALFLQPAWAGEITNRLSFHLLVDDPPEDALIEGTINPGNVKFLHEPILSDKDFTAFDTTNHLFWITADAAKRVSSKRSRREGPSLVAGKPTYRFDDRDMAFVLVASGKPIYVGVFSSAISSSGYGVPTVWAEAMFLPAENTNNFGFVIFRSPRPERPGEAPKPDVRNDGMILRAVKELGLPANGRPDSLQNLDVMKAIGGD